MSLAKYNLYFRGGCNRAGDPVSRVEGSGGSVMTSLPLYLAGNAFENIPISHRIPILSLEPHIRIQLKPCTTHRR